LTHHIEPGAAGTIFTAAAPKLAVYTHLILPGGGGRPGPTIAELEAETRTTYAGPLVVGRDLDRFIVRPGGVETQHFAASPGR
jgi:ribonuclease Z